MPGLLPAWENQSFLQCWWRWFWLGGQARPSADLLGCCTFGATSESCVYADSEDLNQAMCEQAGGTWSEKP